MNNLLQNQQPLQDPHSSKLHYMEECHIKLQDLLPEGVNSVDQLKKLYEEKRDHKKRTHLDCISKAHQGSINCVIFSPDYKFIISGSDDESIKIFDAETKQEVHHIERAHRGSIKTLAMTLDGQYLVSASDRVIKIFRLDSNTNRFAQDFAYTHDNPVISLAIRKNKNITFISGPQNQSCFDLEIRQPARHVRDFDQGLKTIKMISGKLAALLTVDGSILILDLVSANIENSFSSCNFGTMTSIVIKHGRTKDDDLIIAGCDDGSVKILHILDRREVHHLGYEPVNMAQLRFSIVNPVEQVALNSDGRFLCAGFRDGSLVMWNLGNHNERRIPQGKCYRWHQIAVSKNADYLITCSRGQQSINIIDIEPAKKGIICLEGSNGGENDKISFSISRNSEYILTATASRVIKIFHSQTQQIESSFELEERICSLALTPNNSFIIIGLQNGWIKILKFEDKELHNDYEGVFEDRFPTIAVTHDSRYIFVTSDRTSFKMFDIQTKVKKEVCKFDSVHDGFISCITGTPDSKFIVSASHDKSLKLFEIATQKEIHHFKQVHKGAVSSVAVTPNNKFILSASADMSIKIFDLETKNQIHEFVYSHDSRITTLSISYDSRYAASGSADRSIKIFDLETKQLVSSFEDIHNESVTQVAFAPNNNYLVSMSLDGSLKIISFKNIMEDEQTRVSRSLVTVINLNNQLILVIREFHTIRGVDMKTRQEKFRIHCQDDLDLDEAIDPVAVSFDNNFIVFGTSKGGVGRFDRQANKNLPFLKGIHRSRNTITAVTAVAITPNGELIISASREKIKISCWRNGEKHHTFRNLHQDPSYSIAVTPNSQFIILSSGDKSIRILDIQERKQIDNFEDAHRRPIRCVAVTNDEKFIVSCSDDRIIKIFDFKTKQLAYWFKNAHNDAISSLAISEDCRFLVSRSSDKSIKVFDFQTRQQIHHFKRIHTGDIKSITVTPNSKYVISACSGSSIKILKLTLAESLPNQIITPQNQGSNRNNGFNASEGEIYYVYSGLSQYLNFNAVDDFLFDTNIPIKLVYASAVECQNLTVYPYGWNILHLVAIRAQDTFIKNMPGYAQFKVPFLLDIFSKTPLHYLIAHAQINFNCVNILLNYICDYLDDLNQDKCYQAQQIIISLTPLFWFILTKTDVDIRARFFNLCSTALPIPYHAELPIFAKTKTDVQRFCPKLEEIYGSLNSMWEKGEDYQINFRANIVNLDYNVLSDDMKKTIQSLLKQENEETFKAILIIDLIDFLWDQTELFLQINFWVFSAYIIALSVYISQEDRSLAYEIVILCCSTTLLLIEGLQFGNLKWDYFKDYWNYIDLIFHPLTIAYVIARISGVDDELVRAWICSIILLLGYLRWVSYLRVWKLTRSFIEVVVTVVQDMLSFIILIALIIIGFSLIFLVFNRGHLYGFYLFNAYSSLYGPVDSEESSPSELLWIALVAFLLNVIFLNLLIAIMVDSYVKVRNKRIKADSLTRLDMISEAVPILKCLRFIKLHKFLKFLKCNWCLRRFQCLQANQDLTRGFLVRCKSLSSTADDGDKWEGRLNILRKLFSENDNSTKKEIKKSQQDLQQNLVRVDQKRKSDEERLEAKIIASETRLQAELQKMRNDQNEKIGEMLALLTKMIQSQGVSQPNNQMGVEGRSARDNVAEEMGNF